MNGRTNALIFVSCRTSCHMTPLQQKQNCALCMFEVHAGNFHGRRIRGCRSSLCTQENREKEANRMRMKMNNYQKVSRDPK